MKLQDIIGAADPTDCNLPWTQKGAPYEHVSIETGAAVRISACNVADATARVIAVFSGSEWQEAERRAYYAVEAANNHAENVKEKNSAIFGLFEARKILAKIASIETHRVCVGLGEYEMIAKLPEADLKVIKDFLEQGPMA